VTDAPLAAIAAQLAQAWAAFDFGALPPEINSGRMYLGPGAGPLLAAATAWDGLAADLDATADSYRAVISELTTRQWMGPTSVSMVAAITPYVAWLSMTAAQAEQAGMQGKAAAAAYETAFSGTVPPPVIAENRLRLLTLIATNFLGQNTPAIAATEAEYAEFWAQDATAMYGYASGSAGASALTPFTEPPGTTSASGIAGQQAAVDRATALGTSTIQRALALVAPQHLSSLNAGPIPQQLVSGATAVEGDLAKAAAGAGGPPALTTADWSTLVNTWGLSYFGAGIFQLGCLFAQQVIPTSVVPPAASATAVPLVAHASTGIGAGTGPVGASLAQAEKIGRLSVPPNWAVPSSTLVDSKTLVSGPIQNVGSTSPTNGLLPAPPIRGQGRGSAFGRRRYGVRLTVMPRAPGAG